MSYDVEFQAAEALNTAGHLPEAITRYQALLRRAGQLTPERERILSRRLSGCWQFLGEPAKALPHVRREVQLAEQLYGPAGVQGADARSDLGSVLASVGRLDEAAHEIRAALAIMEGRGDTHGRVYGATLMAMAAVEHARDHWALELEWLLRAEPVLRQFHERPNYAALIANMAMCYHRLRRPEQARAKHLEGLALVLKVRGAEHPEYATALGNFAVFFADLKLFDAAIAPMEQAVRIRALVVGRQHPLTTTYQGLLNVWYQNAASEPLVHSLGTRWLLCAHCNHFIDRELLLVQGVELRACNACDKVAYCSDSCIQAHHVQHVCGQPRAVRRKFVDVLASNCCNYCLCTKAQQRCAACKTVQYCDAQCQRADWEQHKPVCARNK